MKEAFEYLSLLTYKNNIFEKLCNAETQYDVYKDKIFYDTKVEINDEEYFIIYDLIANNSKFKSYCDIGKINIDGLEKKIVEYIIEYIYNKIVSINDINDKISFIYYGEKYFDFDIVNDKNFDSKIIFNIEIVNNPSIYFLES